MGPRTRIDDQELQRLRVDFGGHRIFRAVRSDGVLGEWVASLRDPAAGVDATVMEPTPSELRAVLIEEARRAEMKPGVRIRPSDVR